MKGFQESILLLTSVGSSLKVYCDAEEEDGWLFRGGMLNIQQIFTEWTAYENGLVACTPSFGLDWDLYTV